MLIHINIMIMHFECCWHFSFTQGKSVVMETFFMEK